MRLIRSLSTLALLAGLSGCYFPREAAHNAASIEQPQPVHFFYGTVIAVRDVTTEYYGQLNHGFDRDNPAWRPRGRDALLIPFGVLAEGLLPNLPALEYTIVLDGNTTPPDAYLNGGRQLLSGQPYSRSGQHPAIVVVQNQDPNDPADWPRPGVNDRVFIRVLGGSGHVFAAKTLPAQVAGADGERIDIEHNLTGGPMPLPLGWQPCDTVATIAWYCDPWGYHPRD